MELSELYEASKAARVVLSAEELQAALAEVNEILGFFAALQSCKAGQDGGAAADSPHFKSESPGQWTDTDGLLSSAGKRDGRFIVIPNVL